MIYLISDLHFGHDNIRIYENRPYDSVESMNKDLIKNWNQVVSKRDTVYCLGDFSFYPFNKTKEIFDQLNGIKHLIMGNHDRSHTRTWWKRIGFDIVINNPIIFYKEKLILSHEPFKELPKDFVNIHGHLHSKKLTYERVILGLTSKNINIREKYINVSVDVINFKPILLEKIQEFLTNDI